MYIKSRNTMNALCKCRDRALTGPQYRTAAFNRIPAKWQRVRIRPCQFRRFGFPAERSMPVPYISAESDAMGIFEILICIFKK